MKLPSHVRMRLALWSLGKVLPQASALVPHARAALIAVAAAAAGGIFIAAALVAALAGLYFYLSQQAVSDGAIIVIVGTVSLLLGVIAMLVARQSLNRSVRVIPSALEMRIEKEVELLPELVNMAIKGFIQGFLEEPEDDPEEAQHTTKAKVSVHVSKTNGAAHVVHH